ncbi:MAG: NADH-ubiquinone oxidoreductase-F iron-sulfur binding region domain-containing protein [Acidimicrobiales bacterium]
MSGTGRIQAPPRPGSPVGGVAAPTDLPRLLAGLDQGGATLTLAEHLRLWGSPPWRSKRPADLIGAIDRAGLRGRGGAWFPAERKWRAVSGSALRLPVVVANGAEAEPASEKDKLLLSHVPHLVLDGADLAATAVRASRVIIYCPPDLVARLQSAVAERVAWGVGPVKTEVFGAARSFVAGEESAVVGHLNGRPGALPMFTGVQPVYRRGVADRPTLVQNVETLAHAALIGRFGADWFRSLGTADSPGSALLTVSCAGGAPARIVEIALGAPLRSVLTAVSVEPSSVGAVLTGGFGGTWISGPDGLDVPVCEESLRRRDATLGAGVIGVLPLGACPLSETAHIAAYMQTQGAGQCGPCSNGLPAISAAVANLAWEPRVQAREVARIEELCGQVAGRGACHHPDGVVRLVRTMLRVFPDHVASHLGHGPCDRAGQGPVLPVPVARCWTGG